MYLERVNSRRVRIYDSVEKYATYAGQGFYAVTNVLNIYVEKYYKTKNFKSSWKSAVLNTFIQINLK